MGINFVTASLLVLIVWLCWLFGAWSADGDDNHWHANRADFSAEAQCQDSEWNGGVTTLNDGVVVCLAAFLLWASPLMLFGICLFLGLFLILLSRTITHSDASSTRYATKFLAYISGLTVFGMYGAASIGGAGMQLSYAAFSIYGVALFAIVLVVGSTIGWGTLKTSLASNPYVMRARSLGSPWIDMVHGLCVLLCPVYFIFLILSFLNQTLRKVACNCGVCKPLTKEERRSSVTLIATNFNKYLAHWEWSGALFWAQLFCLAAWAMRYGSILTNIGMNRLISVLSTLHYLVTSALFVVIGLIMFLIPVVPGPVVYLTSGVLLVPTMEATLGGRSAAPSCGDVNATANATGLLDLGSGAVAMTGNATSGDDAAGVSHWPFWGACIYANAISYILKLVAHILQQKMIGEPLGSIVSVRAMVSPNSRIMKAINFLLRQPGVTLAKVSIMCGGPDWPTSVLCGFLKLSLPNLLLGLTPMFLMTVPTTLTGAFLNPPTASYNNLVPLMFLIVLFVQLVLGVGMMHYVNHAYRYHGDEIDAIPDDEEVKALEAREAGRNKVRKEVSKFENLPAGIRYFKVLATIVMVISAYALNMMSSRLFKPFGLRDCPETLYEPPHDFIPGAGMSWMGFVALMALLFGIIEMYFFGKWVGRKVKCPRSPSGYVLFALLSHPLPSALSLSPLSQVNAKCGGVKGTAQKTEASDTEMATAVSRAAGESRGQSMDGSPVSSGRGSADEPQRGTSYSGIVVRDQAATTNPPSPPGGEEEGVYPPPQPLNLEEGGGGGHRGSPLSRRPSPPPTMYTL